MSAIETGVHWLALALSLGALAAGVSALTARSLFAMCMSLSVAGALAAGAALAGGADEAALALVLFAAAWAPLMLLAVMLLTTRTAKTARRGAAWAATLIAATAAGAAILFAASDVQPVPLPTPLDLGAVGFWLSPLVLAAAAACIALLGYGERGALQQDGRA